jgi:predicted transcriptional regulator
MEVHFTPEQHARLAQIAAQAGAFPEDVVSTLVTRYLDAESRFLAAVDKGLAAAERGEFLEEEEMDARLGIILGESDRDQAVQLAISERELTGRLSSLDRGEHVEPAMVRNRLALRSEEKKRRA